jgi:hypothetical protein
MSGMSCQWSQRAVRDLVFKVKSEVVREYLIEVSKTSLDCDRAPWGGSIDGLLWRYGVAQVDETLEEQRLDKYQKLARTYRIVYVFRPRTRCFEVLGILTEGEIIAAYKHD